MGTLARHDEVLHTALNPQMCCDRLQERLYVYRPFHWSRRSRHPIMGCTSPAHFSIRKRTGLPQVFSFQLSGTFEGTAVGTRIDVHWLADSRMRWVCLLAGAAFIALAFTLLFPTPSEIRVSGFFVFLPLIIFLVNGLGYFTVAYLLYLWRIRRQRRFLRQFLRVHLAAA